MTITSISQTSYNHRNNTQKRTSPAFSHGHTSTMSTGKKAVVFATSTAGVIGALALCGKSQKINIFKMKELKNIDIGTKEIYAMAAGSIVGGLASGLAIDRENKKSKYREAMQQMIGNIIFPITFVSIANLLYKKAGISKKIPKLNNKILNAVTQAIVPSTVTLTALVSGIITGNKTANKINNHIFKTHESRDIKVSDFAAHVDDLCLGATLIAKNLSGNSNSFIGSITSKLIPPALIIQGYLSGTATHTDNEAVLIGNKF